MGPSSRRSCSFRSLHAQTGDGSLRGYVFSRHLFGNGDDNSLDGGGRESGVAYRPYSVRMAGQYFAPFGIKVAGSYVIQAGAYLGPVLVQSGANPVFGPVRGRRIADTSPLEP